MIALLSLALAAASPFGAEPATAEGLRAAEAGWAAAIEASDVARLACRLGVGFVDTNWQGKLVLREAVLAALPGRADSKLALSDVTVRIEGQTGIVHGLNTQTKPGGEVVASVRFTDVFLYRAHRWQAISAQETVAQP